MNKLAFIALIGFGLVEWLTVTKAMRREGLAFSFKRYWSNYKWGLIWNAAATGATLYFSEFMTSLLRKGLAMTTGEEFATGMAEAALEPLVWFLMGSCGALFVRHILMRAQGFLTSPGKQPEDQ